MIEIYYPDNNDDIASVRALFIEYAASLNLDLSYQGFEKELEELPGCYAPPSGYLLIAKAGHIAAGCVAIRKIDEHCCEMKRLYIPPQYRGQKIGKQMVIAIINKAKELDYRTLKLDTRRSMKEAVNLYESLGFRETGAYEYSPVDDAVFFELILKE